MPRLHYPKALRLQTDKDAMPNCKVLMLQSAHSETCQSCKDPDLYSGKVANVKVPKMQGCKVPNM